MSIQELGLKPNELAIIQEWIASIGPIKERHPKLHYVDLVIEGGVGTGCAMSSIAMLLFPGAVYVGMDLSQHVGSIRYTGNIDKKGVDRITPANTGVFDPNAALIQANCFDAPLIQAIAQETDAHFPILVSLNALFGLFDRSVSPAEGAKREKDVVSMLHALNNVPYVAQLHLTQRNPWAEGNLPNCDAVFRSYQQLAEKQGFTTERLSIGNYLFRGRKNLL